jgi:flagellar assembly protein FliH
VTTETFSFPVLSGTVVSRAATAVELAAEVVERARGEADHIRERAQAEGYADGRAAAAAAAATDVASACEVFAGAVTALDQRLDVLSGALERQAGELAVAIAERILGVALGIRPDLVAGVAAGALRANGGRERVTLEVSPDDVSLVRAAVDALPALAGRAEVIPQRDIPRGGCLVRSDEGETDGRISVQLERAAEVVSEALARRGADGDAQ